MLRIDYKKIVSESDLVYRKPAVAPYDGLPVGNGRMGTLVWTTPGSVQFQINRGDVFAVGRNHQSHQAWPLGPKGGTVDYCGGCAKVTVDLGGELFTESEIFEQRLSLYEAEVTVRGKGVNIRCFISSVSDILVMEIDDRRPEPRPVDCSRVFRQGRVSRRSSGSFPPGRKNGTPPSGCWRKGIS